MLFADSPPPGFDAWLANLCFIFAGIAAFTVFIDRAIAVWDRLTRRKPPSTWGEVLITQERVQEIVVPITDALTRHTNEDAEQFRYVREVQGEHSRKLNEQAVTLARIEERMELMQTRGHR